MERIVQAVAISFLHSLWQGLIIVALGAVVILLAKRYSSLFRYTILCILFTLFILCFGYTLGQQLSGPGSFNHAGSASEQSPQAILSTAAGSSWIAGILEWYKQNSFLVMGIWLLILLVRTVFLLKSLVLLNRIKHNDGMEVNEFWRSKLQELAGILKMQVNVSLRQSYLVTQPVIIGFFKPVIFFPVALLNNLSVKDAETILLHELAHIRRRDSIVNFIQVLVESIFFFNPALLWISSQIRREREYCCDDIAIGQKGERSFLEALVSFHEYQPLPEKYTLAFSGTKSLLRKRVNRIIRSKQGVGKINILISVCCILAAFAFISFNTFSRTVIKKQEQRLTTGLSTTTSQDSIPAKPFSAGKTKGRTIIFPEPVQTFQMGTSKTQPFIKDTIPFNASKEFIAGYKAGMAYKEGGSIATDEKASIERQLIANGATKPKTDDNIKKTLDNLDRIEMEKAAKLRAEQK